MDINNWNSLFEENQRRLSDILDDCQNGPDELALLASKMSPLLDEINLLREQIADPSADSPAPESQNIHKVSEEPNTSN